MKKKVMVGMSGGVDSSVAAAVLMKEGYDVIGVTLKLQPDTENGSWSDTTCCSLVAVEDARRVASKLGIPYYVLNFQDIFESCVVEYFVAEYGKGRTPNPCIACNRYIKFDALLKKAESMGIDYVATGHYARIEYDEQKNRYLLKKSVTGKKDQTYVLYNLTQYQLQRTLMPIGRYDKDTVRDMAKELGFDVANKPDSQEICFIPDNNYAAFITNKLGKPAQRGKFVDIHGNVLGEHKGLIHYTVGQRKGLGLSFGKPMYVIKIDAENNTVVLGEEKDVFSAGLTAFDLNWIAIDSLDGALRVKAKIRYSANEADAVITPIEGGKVRVDFDKPQRAVTPGQSVVFYDGDIVVGGGIIERKDI
ncbi:MAG TPA: tRNA 2-thiouridine(34) synthase MnmA [Ruminiclostridium sp.]|jgi:tRNA-specific 2-thiouridylase|nr:tRNA 2-thiouridine(34) synthase MnmA [Clostridiaceae bacterium]HAA24536.1 tRNA 2-thiouridine(34) synthase MnmA [Ruminiclostridium sp.]